MNILNVNFTKNKALDDALNAPQFIWSEKNKNTVGAELIEAAKGYDALFCMTDGGLYLTNYELSQLPKIIQFTQDAYSVIPENILRLGGMSLFSNM